MNYKKFVKKVNQYFDVKSEIIKSNHGYFVRTAYLKFDDTIRYTISYSKKRRSFSICTTSYVNNKVSVVECKGKFENALLQLFENVIKEHIYWHKYYYNEFRKENK